MNTQDESTLKAKIASEFEDSLYDQYASSSAVKHHEDNEKFRQKFNMDVESVYQTIPCTDQLKQVLSTGEREVKVFIQDRLSMQKTAVTERISKNKFPLLNIGSTKSTSINP